MQRVFSKILSGWRLSFFVSLDWLLGMYGHPWKKEIIVVGEKLIQEFEKVQNALNITEL